MKGSFLGLKSGKLGEAVAQANNGEQVWRIYRRNIKNPRSEGQLRQRAKMNLVGQLSKLITPSMIEGLRKGSRRDNRTALLASLAKATTVTYADGVYTASITASDIRFSDGAQAKSNGLTTSVSFGADDVEFTVAASGDIDADELARTALKGIVLAVNDATSRFDLAKEATLAMPSAPGASAVTVVHLGADVVGGHTLFAYEVPMYYDVSAARAFALSHLGVDTVNGAVIATLSSRGVITASSYGPTRVVGSSQQPTDSGQQGGSGSDSGGNQGGNQGGGTGIGE